MFKLFIEKVWSSAYCFGPMGKGVYHTICIRWIMVTILLQVLLSMDGFAVNCNREGMVCLQCDQGIREEDSPIVLVAFDCELYFWIYTADMIQKYLYIGLLLDDKSVIHIPEPMPGRVGGQTVELPLPNVPCTGWLQLDLLEKPIGAPSTCL